MLNEAYGGDLAAIHIHRAYICEVACANRFFAPELALEKLRQPP